MLGLIKERRLLRAGTRFFSKKIDHGDARIFVDHGFQWDGSKNVWLTRARASFVMGGGPAFELRERSTLSQFVGLSAGASSGDTCFDNFFRVTTRDRANTFDALTTHARWLLASTFADALLISDGSMVTLCRQGDFGRERDGDIAAEVVSEIVHFGTQALRALQILPYSQMNHATGSWDQRIRPSAVVSLDVPVTLSTERTPDGIVSSASTTCGRAQASFCARLDMRGQWHAVANSPLPEYLRTADPKLGPASLTCENGILRLCWDKLVSRQYRLMEGARLVSTLASSHKNLVFR